MNILELAILKKMVGGGGGSGTDNYNDLSNLPQINGETLAGNKTAENLGLQDALTFDSTPTEDSTNPVESGGVFNALAGKQDNLTFDGTYDASTNKAATESTVTDAINELDVSETSFDADETIDTISETDGKIAVTKKDIAIASNQVTSMTGYTKPSSAPATPAIQTNDTANQAFGKLEFKADTNQTNISSVQEADGQKNFFPYFKLTCGDSSKLSFNEDGTITSTITIDSRNWQYANREFEMTFKPGDYVVKLYYDNNGSPSINRLALIASNDQLKICGSGNNWELKLHVDATVTYGIMVKALTTSESAPTVFRVMVCTKSQFDISSAYQPFALPNYDLTVREAEDRAALVEQVDEGAKNLFNFTDLAFLKSVNTQGTWNGNVYTRNSVTFTVNDDGTITVNGTNDSSTINAFMNYGEVSPSAFSFTGDVISGSVPNGKTVVSIRNGAPVYSALGESSNGNASTISAPAGGANVITYILLPAGQTANNEVIRPMICTEADWKISQNFAPFALPNTDLTVLEAEDRAALAEEIDSGAKNIFELPSLGTLKYHNSMGTWNNNEYTLNGVTFTVNTADNTVSTTGTANALAFFVLQIYSPATTKYSGDVLSGCPHGGNFDNGYFLYASDDQSVTQNKDTGDGGIFNNNAIRAILIGCRSGVSMSGLTFKPMICTKAEYDVSQAYVPYRKNLDQLEATKAPALSTITMDSGSLDDITTNSFIACSWEVAGKPISTMGFVRTSVFDANSALQEFYSFSADETQSCLVYVRDKQAGVWRSWKLLTNNT